MSAYGRLRPHVPIFALLALFLALLTAALWQTSQQANRVEAERSVAAVQVAFDAFIDRQKGTMSANANWDDAVRAVYAPTFDRDFAGRIWTTGTNAHVNYDEVHVVDADGRTLWSAIDGVSVAPQALSLAKRSLVARIDRHTDSAAALFLRGTQVEIVSLGLIVPTTRALSRIVPDAGPFRLIFVRRVTPDRIAGLGRGLMLDDLTIGGETPERQNAVLAGHDGQPIASLSWRTRKPGNEALLRAAPALVVALIVFLAICSLIVRDTLASVRELARQAVVDSLSQLPNRRALRRALAEACTGNRVIALALIDLDGFKGVNDNYGHAVGDRLIRAVGDVLRDIAGETTLVARLGGDEFAILATGNDAGALLEAQSLQLLERLRQPFRLDERTLCIGASVGHAFAVQGTGIAPIELLRRADVAMYAAKRSGRMRIVRYDTVLDADQAAKHQIESELRIAIAAGDFNVVYQPLLAADRVTLTGVEALIRWVSPTLGAIPPERFVPIAEETGLIDRIGLFVLDRACRDAAAWAPLRLAVNVSAAQLRNPEFPEQLGAVLRTTGFPPGRLEIEITETYLVREAETAREVLNAIRALGVTVSLDDFGTGFASIGFLRQFTFDKLKIDRSLVADAEHSASARAMVQASVAVARALDMSVTAEGVETLAQADVMRVIGCDELQGWLFARAESASQITARATRQAADRAQPRRAAH